MPDDRSQHPSIWPLAVSAAIACLVLIVGGYTYYQSQSDEIRAKSARDLAAIATLKTTQIVNWRNAQIRALEIATTDPFISAGIAEWVAQPENATLRARAQGHLRRMVDVEQAHDVLLASPEGRLLLSASIDRRDLDADERALAVRAAEGGLALAGEIVRSSTGQVVFLMAAPVRDGGGRVVAVQVAAINPESVLFQVLGMWPTPSASSETMLARQDGDHIVYLNTLRHRPGLPLTITVPMTERQVGAVRLALGGTHEVFAGVDYRGVPILSDLRPVPGSTWLLVTKIDHAEILAELRYRSWTTLLLVLLFMATSVGVAAFVYVNRHRAVYRNLGRVERQRREALEEVRATLYSIGDGVITTDGAGRVTRLNPVAEALTGWQEADASGRPIADVFHIINEETRSEVENPVWRVLREGVVVGLANHTLLIARDGVERPIADSGAPIRTPAGETRGAVLVFRDQTEERRAVGELKAASMQWQTTFDAMTDAVVLLDAGGTILRGNRSFVALLGDACPEPAGRNIEDLRTGGILRVPECPIHRARETRARVRQEAEDGARTYLVVTDPIVTGSNEPVAGFVCAFRDITERKRDLAERERLQTELHQTWKMESIGRLAGGVAHDFNNMLAVILGHVELAMDDLDQASPVYDNLREIKLATQHSANLTGQLLAFSRQQPIRPELLDLNQAVAALLPMLRRLIGENIQLVWTPGAALWGVEADATQIGRIVANLALNARDAIGGVGTVTVGTGNIEVTPGTEAAARTGTEPGDYVMLSVTDTGCGMDAETRDHIFEPFFTTKAVGQGTGLGLATVHGVVKQNHGCIDVDSAPGHGTTFRIYLPRAVAGAEPAGGPHDAPAPKGGAETILLVEDEPAMLTLSRKILERAGYRVLAAGRPAAAIELAAQHDGPIHLLLTDVVMPEMNGRDLRDRLLAMRPDLKVLFMSGYTADIITHHGRLEDDVQFLQKPFTGNSLSQAVRDALDHAG